MIKNVLFDAAIPVHSLLSKYMASYCDFGTYEYDPDKARALLEEAGSDRSGGRTGRAGRALHPRPSGSVRRRRLPFAGRNQGLCPHYGLGVLP